nr:universal stress protein [Candidatus Coxiella mudrowiae]
MILFIVGTHGHHGIDKLLGSQANAILHAPKYDVLTSY